MTLTYQQAKRRYRYLRYLQNHTHIVQYPQALQSNGVDMRYRIGFLSTVLILVAACSVPSDGDEAKVHAKRLGFTVTGENASSVVVKIGEHCSGEFTSWTAGNGDQINRVFRNGKDIWNLNDTKAEGPDQFKNFSVTADCYDK